MSEVQGKRERLVRVARRVADYEQTMSEGLRGFSYSTDPSEVGAAHAKYVFQDGQVVGIDAALARICLVANLYGLDDH